MFIWSHSVCCNLLAGEAVTLSKSDHQRKVNTDLTVHTAGHRGFCQMCSHTTQMSSVEESCTFLYPVQDGFSSCKRCFFLCEPEPWDGAVTSLAANSGNTVEPCWGAHSSSLSFSIQVRRPLVYSHEVPRLNPLAVWGWFVRADWKGSPPGKVRTTFRSSFPFLPTAAVSSPCIIKQRISVWKAHSVGYVKHRISHLWWQKKVIKSPWYFWQNVCWSTCYALELGSLCLLVFLTLM